MNDAMLRAYDNGVFIVFAHPRRLGDRPRRRIIAANMSVPGQNVGLPTNVDTEDAGGWPEAVTRRSTWTPGSQRAARAQRQQTMKSATQAR
jgi:hypothetical protein